MMQIYRGYETEEDWMTNVREVSKRCTGGSRKRTPRFGILIRRIIQEKVNRVFDQAHEPILYLDPYPQTQLLEIMVQNEIEKASIPVSVKPAKIQRRPTYTTVTKRSRVPTHQHSQEKLIFGEQLTTDNRPVCFHCGCPGHVMRYCREKKAIFDSYRNRRQSFDEIEA
ncbi:CCHC-type domain-containing protein [Trichonephila clavata]|uniref:CCHC-type domain-containing protein n=1 Tax=Trichonephila clavata TaxID=2740835 RepID=A0A8X6HZK4_TRICU|nr:CCHC-type domain-containing protein [Trichonephila clavata]